MKWSLRAAAVLALTVFLAPGAFGQSITGKLLAGKKLTLPYGLDEGALPERDSKGAKLLVKYCGSCHNLPNPKMYSKDEWPSMFQRMMSHVEILSNIREGVLVPKAGDKKDIVDYLTRSGFAALSPGDPSLREDVAFDFAWFCSTCHSMPGPGQHTASEWPVVVERMEGFRKAQGREAMTAAQKENIIKFLTEKK